MRWERANGWQHPGNKRHEGNEEDEVPSSKDIVEMANFRFGMHKKGGYQAMVYCTAGCKTGGMPGEENVNRHKESKLHKMKVKKTVELNKIRGEKKELDGVHKKLREDKEKSKAESQIKLEYSSLIFDESKIKLEYSEGPKDRVVFKAEDCLDEEAEEGDNARPHTQPAQKS